MSIFTEVLKDEKIIENLKIIHEALNEAWRKDESKGTHLKPYDINKKYRKDKINTQRDFNYKNSREVLLIFLYTEYTYNTKNNPSDFPISISFKDLLKNIELLNLYLEEYIIEPYIKANNINSLFITWKGHHYHFLNNLKNKYEKEFIEKISNLRYPLEFREIYEKLGREWEYNLQDKRKENFRTTPIKNFYKKWENYVNFYIEYSFKTYEILEENIDLVPKFYNSIPSTLFEKFIISELITQEYPKEWIKDKYKYLRKLNVAGDEGPMFYELLKNPRNNELLVKYIIVFNSDNYSFDQVHARIADYLEMAHEDDFIKGYEKLVKVYKEDSELPIEWLIEFSKS